MKKNIQPLTISADQVYQIMMQQGCCALIAEYRGCTPGVISWVSDKTGRRENMAVLDYKVETLDPGACEQMTLTENLPDSVLEPDPSASTDKEVRYKVAADVQAALKRGQVALFLLSSLAVVKGKMRSRLKGIYIIQD